MVRPTSPVFSSGDGVVHTNFAGLSTDTKPTTDLATGCLFLEIDTGDVYAYNEVGNSDSKWLKIAELGGSGS